MPSLSTCIHYECIKHSINHRPPLYTDMHTSTENLNHTAKMERVSLDKATDIQTDQQDHDHVIETYPGAYE